MRITVRGDGSVALTVPRGVSESRAMEFLRAKGAWILRKVREAEAREKDVSPAMRLGASQYARSRDAARRELTERVAALAAAYGVRYGRVAVRNQKSRWGSCSREGNLSFNFRIVFLPARVRDYIVAHEVCHLAEFNHSVRFWALVARTVPDHREIRRELRGKWRM